MDLGLTDRVYVLTGASRGLGFATAQCLVAEGARVVLSSRDGARVAAAVDALGGPDRAVGLVADLADWATTGRLVATARKSFGRLDGALISVGGPPPGTAATVTDEQWRQGDPAEFGRVAAFVLSPAAGYLTGITIPVDGGATRGL